MKQVLDEFSLEDHVTKNDFKYIDKLLSPSEPNLSGFKVHHTLADFLSPIFDKSYLHAFKKARKAQKKITALSLISSRYIVRDHHTLANYLLAIENRYSPDKWALVEFLSGEWPSFCFAGLCL